ncbi:MAG: hypothetical protein DI598_10410 [Pseudopedobacter saltans]|uniref:Uncharacterized protein n=1 Tax=Pseudopedobacter saltans TaxID=151895 RepID=A0A2W5EZX8_9SPHI|nr:MAG: hypothetical protein DI598_10410 [Pseudopedobacter saltans]
MDKLKRFLGIVWLLLTVVFAYYCIAIFGWPKLVSGKQDDLVFGIVILFVLTPIIVGGLGMFAYYSLIGEYDESKA